MRVAILMGALYIGKSLNTHTDFGGMFFWTVVLLVMFVFDLIELCTRGDD